MINALERMMASVLLMILLSVMTIIGIYTAVKCNEMLELLKECERVMCTSFMENPEEDGRDMNHEKTQNQILQAESQQ